MNNAKCAHKKILGKVTKPDTNGCVKDYWICGDCGAEIKIEPLPKLMDLKGVIKAKKTDRELLLRLIESVSKVHGKLNVLQDHIENINLRLTAIQHEQAPAHPPA